MTSVLPDLTYRPLPPRGARLLDAEADRPQPLPPMSASALIELVRRSGLLGRGGAGFPTWRKLAAVAAGSSAVVVANGAEGEPASRKDTWLLAHRPHLVLDGLDLVTTALSASEVYLYVGAAHLVPRLQQLATAQQRSGGAAAAVRVIAAPPTFLAGEETAAVAWIAGRAPAPRSKPPLVVARGLHGRPTLVQNVETLAQLALLARYGPEWFRSRGTPAEPGTMLVTVSGAVATPGVAEVDVGAALQVVLGVAGGASAPLSAVLLGGYHGSWIGAADLTRVALSRGALAELDAVLGAGVVLALPTSSCGLIESARAVSYLARQSAGQCGPCLNGLPRLAQLLAGLASGGSDGRATPGTVAELRRIAGLVDGRGACHHPDGTVRFLRSALRVFDAEVAAHLHGTCTATSTAPVLPIDDAGSR
jgi:NADH:ubiquinone oxidoreductase subunit F (NADH-binding)